LAADHLEGTQRLRLIICKTHHPSSLGLIHSATSISCLYPIYVRGEAYLAAGEGGPRRWRISENPRAQRNRLELFDWCSGAFAAWPPLRAAGRHSERSRRLSKDFLTLWEDADADIPVLKQARAEYAKLE
jgi:hypothetical protein